MKPAARRILLIGLVATVVTTVVLTNRRREAAALANPLVRGSGTVEATELDLAAETSGRLSEVRVAEGDSVVAGQVLAVIQRDSLAAELDRAAAAADTARMRLADLEAGTRPEEVRIRAARLREALTALESAQTLARTAQAAYARPTELRAAADSARAKAQQARASTTQAKAQWAEAKAGAREQEIAEARAAVASAEQAVGVAKAGLVAAEQALAGATAELPAVRTATRERESANTQVAAATTRVAAAEQALAAAEARREQVNNSPRPDQREQVQRRIDSQQAALTLAGEQYARDQQLFGAGAIAKKQLEASLARRDQAQAALAEARAALRDLEAGARAPERREADAAVARATAELGGARADLENAKREQQILVSGAQQANERAGSAVTQAAARRDQARESVQQAARASDQAAARLALILAGTRQERLEQAAAGVAGAAAGEAGAERAVEHARQAQSDRFALRQALEAAQGQVSAARAKVETAQADLDLALAGTQASKLSIAGGEVRQAEATRELAATRLEDTVIRAPRAGTVTELILREGETVTPGAVVLRLLDLQHLWVRIYLPVRQFGKVVRGMAATVTADAYPGQEHPGTVLSLSESAEFTPKNTQTVEERVKQVFWVKVGVGDGRGKLKPGLPADVVLDTAGR
ncbi:MAG: HlyD family efflux transporter periplasmic adaptor subunit [Fimbriimonadaceae bacterium]|nr:HlyD family efflux transporter periplasmic adaptor subunit [Fimbriimonadaceae bacterium]